MSESAGLSAVKDCNSVEQERDALRAQLAVTQAQVRELAAALNGTVVHIVALGDSHRVCDESCPIVRARAALGKVGSGVGS